MKKRYLRSFYAPFLLTAIAVLPGPLDSAETISNGAKKSVEVRSAESSEPITIERYWTLLEKSPKRGTVFERVYEHYADSNRIDELTKRCREQVDADPKNERYCLLLGLVLVRQGKSIEAAEVLEKLVSDDQDILVRIAETLEEAGKLDAALRRYRHLVEIAENDDFSRLEFSLAAIDIRVRLGEKNEALEELKSLLDTISTESWQAKTIENRIEQIYVHSNDRKSLTELYRRRLEKSPNNFETIKRLASLQLDQGLSNRAVENARLAVTASVENVTDHIERHLFFAEMLFDLGYHEEGLDVLRRAVQLDENDTTALSVLADRLFETNKIDESLHILRQISDKAKSPQEKSLAAARLESYLHQAGAFSTNDDLWSQRKQSPSTDRDLRSQREPFPLQFASDRTEEYSVLKKFVNDPQGEYEKSRVETAAFRLLGHRLGNRELLVLLDAFRLLQNDVEARKIVRRLMHRTTDVAAQRKILAFLANEKDAVKDPETILFVRKTLKSPPVRESLLYDNVIAIDVRNRALDFLANADLLDEIIEETETRWQNSSNSPELLFDLTDFYVRADRREEALAMLEEIERRIARREISVQTYQNLLMRTGMRQTIGDWRQANR